MSNAPCDRMTTLAYSLFMTAFTLLRFRLAVVKAAEREFDAKAPRIFNVWRLGL